MTEIEEIKKATKQIKENIYNLYTIETTSNINVMLTNLKSDNKLIIDLGSFHLRFGISSSIPSHVFCIKKFITEYEKVLYYKFLVWNANRKLYKMEQ